MRFPVIRPAMPPAERWAGLLSESYAAKRFSNAGPLAQRLEAWLVSTWGAGCSSCVVVSSGTAAITAPLIVAGVRGRVLLPAFTFPATLSAIRMAAAEPLLMDVCPRTWTTDAARLDAAFAASGAKAAVVLRPFGLRTDLTDHALVASRHGAVLVIDDAAGLGVDRDLPERDPWVFEAYSLHATKPFGIGEGGVIFAHRDAEERLRRAINFGLPNPDATKEPTWGINAKMAEFQAAVGLAVADCFAGQLARRRVLAARYVAVAELFPAVVCRSNVSDGAWQFFPMLLPDSAAADRFEAETRARGMEIRRYYAPSLSRFRDVPQLGGCPVSEDLAGRMCCTPVYPDADDDEIEAMTEIVEASLRASLGGS